MITPRMTLLIVAGMALAAAAMQAAEPRLEDVVFVAAHDSTEQRYVRILPAEFDPASPHDLLIALHGHGSDRWQFARQPLAEARAARDIAARHAMIFVSPDYRAATSWMGPAAEADVVQMLIDLKQQFAIRHVIISGASMGGTASLTFAALHPELVDGVVSMNGAANLLEYANFQDAIRASFGGDKRQALDQYKRRSAEYWPERLTMPLATTTGGADRSVPPESVLRLTGVLKQLNRPVLSLHRPDAGHSTTYGDATEAYEFVLGNLKERLR